MFISEVLNKYIVELEEKRLSLVGKHGRSFGWHVLIPMLVGIASVFILGVPPAFLIGTAIAGVISGIIYHVRISAPFSEIKAQLKSAILQDLMKTFHPEIEFSYSSSKQDVRNIVGKSGLVSANRYGEEDVIEGKYGNTEFYISEIHLAKKKKKSTRTVFDGLLFKIKIPGKILPKARIQSRPGLLSKLFGGYEINHEYGFHYDTDDLSQFHQSLGKLFPFFQHLIRNNKDVRISIQENEIVMLLNSDMKFLDDPVPRLKEPLLNSTYVENFSVQLNSLLFIVDALANNLNSKEIEERLELKALEYVNQMEKA